MQNIFVTFASTMMRHLSSILLSFIFILGLILISHEEQPDFRGITENATSNVIGSAESSCSFTVATNSGLPATKRSVCNDRNTYYQITDAILPANSYRHCNTFNQLVRLKAFCIGQLQHLFSIRRTEQSPATTFTPSAIRYSYGYYIYELAHILI